MNLEPLALAVDEQLHTPAADRRHGRLYAVRFASPSPATADAATDLPAAGADPLRTSSPSAAPTSGRPDGDDEPPPSCPATANLAGSPLADAVVLDLLAEGEARTLPQKIRPPEGVAAIALASGVWAAPMEDDGPSLRPSQHPQRRRAHLTVVIGTEAGRDGVDVSVLRYGDGPPTVLRGGLGLVHQRMLRCWARRPDGPWATRRNDAA